jgi:hypothetical protein
MDNVHFAIDSGIETAYRKAMELPKEDRVMVVTALVYAMLLTTKEFKPTPDRYTTPFVGHFRGIKVKFERNSKYL